MRLLGIFILLFSVRVFAAPVQDYEYLPFLDQNIKVGLGMAYSKLESNSDVGNYYLLSAANPRLELSYSSPIVNFYRHKFSGGVTQELYRPENDIFFLKTRDPRYNAFLAWEPTWYNEERTFARYFKFSLKYGSTISELPNTNTLYGDIGDRYSLDGGVGFTWYGLTVSKFPMGFNAEVLYSQTLFDSSATSVYNGLTYRMGLEFEFKKRSLFSGWGARAYYEYEDIKNGYSHVVDKSIGLVLNKSFAF